MPGSSMPFGLGKIIRRMTDPVVGSTVTSRNWRVPSKGYLTVFQEESDLFLELAIVLKSAFFQSASHSQQSGRGLGNIHVDGIQLLNGRQGSGLVGRHQGALRNAGSSDPARDRRGDGGVFQIDAGRLDHGLPILDIRLHLFQSGRGIIIVLLADRFIGSNSRSRSAFNRMAGRLASDRPSAALALSNTAWKGAGSI